MRAFSREALELYIPVIQEEVRASVKEWLSRDSCVLVYPEMKRLMFRIAMRILLGFEPEQIKTDEEQLVEAFEEMIKNLFSLPIDVPFSGLYRVRQPKLLGCMTVFSSKDDEFSAIDLIYDKYIYIYIYCGWMEHLNLILWSVYQQGLKARNFIHSKIEENIKKKVQESDKGSAHRDALQQLIDSSKKNGEALSMQVILVLHHVSHSCNLLL